MLHSFSEDLESAVRSGRGSEVVLVLCLSRLRALASRMLNDNRRLRREHDTDDLLQSAAIRLHRALASVAIDSATHAMALAVTQLKRELIDLIRQVADAEARLVELPGDRAASPYDELLDSWQAFHGAITELPQDQREAVHFLWYLGLTQEDAAKLLGTTSRTLQRRWRAAKAALRERLDADDFRE